MLWIKALHLIFMVTWFSGLFYLPRLFVYHAEATDPISIARFKIMERKLYFGITTPGAVLTVLFGIWLITFNPNYYLHLSWLHAKFGLIFLLLCYHVYLGRLLFTFKRDANTHSHRFYRLINEIPVLFLTLIIILAVVRPTL